MGFWKDKDFWTILLGLVIFANYVLWIFVYKPKA